MAFRRPMLIAAAGAASLLAAAAAFAQPPEAGSGPQFNGPQFSNAQPPQGGRGKIGQKLADPQARSQRLRNQLGLTPNQDQAFNAWIAATAAPAGPPSDEGLTTPQRLDRRLTDLTNRVNATKRFYAALTPEQKQIFDNLPPEVALGQPGPAGRGGALAQAAQAKAKANGKGGARRLARQAPLDPNNPPPAAPGGYSPQ